MVMIGPSSSKHYFKRSVGMTSSLHCEFDEVNTNFLISSSLAGLKLCKVGGGETGLVKGSGLVVGENLILMRTILSLNEKVEKCICQRDGIRIVLKCIRWIPMEY